MPGLVAFGCAKCGIFRLLTHTQTNTHIRPHIVKETRSLSLRCGGERYLRKAKRKTTHQRRLRHRSVAGITKSTKLGWPENLVPLHTRPPCLVNVCSIVFIDWPGRGRAVGHTYTVWRPAGSVSECGKFEKVFNRLFYFFLQLVFFRGTERKHSLSAGQIQQNPIRGLCITIMFCLLLLLHDSFISSVRR